MSKGKGISGKVELVDYIIGQRIKRCRKKYNKSMADIGATIGVTMQQISKYEEGIDRITCSALYKLAHFLKVPIQYFFDIKDEMVHYGQCYSLSYNESKENVINASGE